MADALVGGAFLSSFLNVLFDRLSSPEVVNWIKGKKLDEKLLGRLETSLDVVQAVLNDAEQKQITDPAVKKWLADLEDAVYKADDLMDEVSTKAATQKDPGNIWTRVFNKQDREMVSKIQEVIDKLETLKTDKVILLLQSLANVNTLHGIPTTSLVEKSDIYGRNEDKENIIKLLLEDTSDCKISVVPIVGMGGVGKTTLARLVYNDDKLKGKFDYKAWVCVSEQFDIVKVTKTIIAAVTPSPCDKNDFNLLQNDLKQTLSGKKFLIVLDDLWDDCLEKWGNFKQPFQDGSKGSKILVTTRSGKVASELEQTSQTHWLNLLSEEDCWSMFVKHASLSAKSKEYSTLEETGKKIVAKCKGLPLAVEALGRMLRGNHEVDYWDNISKSEIWKVKDETVIPALRISYHSLPSNLKRCFVFCSLYPKDYEFEKDELILLWMAEEFLKLPKGVNITLEFLGCEYFNELVARSFFQPSSATKGLFVMHDLMHDLATSCAGEFYFRDELENVVAIDNKVSIKTRHLSHNATSNYRISRLVATCDRVKHSRTFLGVNLWRWDPLNMQDAPRILLSHLKCLRVLSFKSFALDSLPNLIGELVHMRYLDLSYTSIGTLPEQLNNLYNLQTLKLNGCKKLKMLPSGIQNLVNLRHLDVRGTCLEEMPKAMSKLKHLQFLSNYIVGKDEENKIRELGPLVTLHRSLDISHLENVVNSDEASEARINDKEYINSLVLSWSSNSSAADSSQMENDILDKLRPHSNLKELSIYGYRGTRLPDWLGDSSYKNMTNLTLKGCGNCCMLPSLGQLPSLKHLKISHFDKLHCIDAEFYKGGESCSETPFRSLETLKFSKLYCWEKWHLFEFGNAFPQLKELTIQGCPVLQLKQLTTWITGDLPNHLPVLEKLTIDEQCKERRACEDPACPLPTDPAMLELTIKSENKLRMQELPLSLPSLSIQGNRLVESVLEAMIHTQPTYLRRLEIAFCDSALSFPADCLPSSLQGLEISCCRKLDFRMQQQQQHDSLRNLTIFNSCDSLTSFPLNAFPYLTVLNILDCENMESLVVVSQSPDTAISSLRSLRVQRCPKFVSFSTLWMAAPKLESLYIWYCRQIDSFPEGGLPPNLRQLSIISCDKLESCLASMDLCSYGLTRLDIGIESESVKSFPKEGWLPTSLESLCLRFSWNLETLDCNGLSHLTSLQSLEIKYCDKLENMTGERLPASLTRLHIRDCPLLRERCRVKDPQISSKISHIPDIKVDGEQIS